MGYEPSKIEKKWQEVWEKTKMYQAENFGKKPKFYALIEFPYPSGAGLHVGHIRSWSAMDTFVRKKRMEGFNILYPIGWDAFGLPAENYAIKMKTHPSRIVPCNIDNFRKQCKILGLSFDWSREVDTTNPKYYKWTQWIFVQLFKKGLAYQTEVPVNWCPACKTNLADEEVLADGTHERCGQPTERRPQKQWLLRITEYADRLLEDLKTVDYSPKIAQQQINWIGRKEWIDITYPIEGTKETVVVSTTRPDTNFGATFIVLAPENPILSPEKGLVPEERRNEVDKYIEVAKNKSELERISEAGKKTGVFTGLYAINQLNGYKMPVWTSDFVLMSVGTGAVVGVPGHDLRDFDFAQQFSLPIIRVVIGKDSDVSPITRREQVQEEEGTMINSGFLDGLNIDKAIEKIMDYLEEKNWGKRTMRYHLRDWVFSRQHYWGEPIPIIHCLKCGPIAVPESQLPIELPYLERYEPSGTGESPLANVPEWVNVKCPQCGSPAKRETDTMPNWAGSNWYFIRYCDPGNDKSLANKDKLKYWLPVDIYQGGFEHTTLHLLYSRFIYKFLYDIGVVPTPEPYAKRRSHGIVLGPDNRKMSKSFGNVVNPDDIVKEFGADTLRLYEMFMGPFDQAIAWDDKSLMGCYRFLSRIWQLVQQNVDDRPTPKNLLGKLHQTIKKASSDLENLKFNTAVATLMEFINEWSKAYLAGEDVKLFIRILAPFVPHISEEIWCEILKNKFSIHRQPWPKFDSRLAKEEIVTIVVQINGRVRGQVLVPCEMSDSQTEIEKLAKIEKNIIRHLSGRGIRKTIFVPGKLINFVV